MDDKTQLLILDEPTRIDIGTVRNLSKRWEKFVEKEQLHHHDFLRNTGSMRGISGRILFSATGDGGGNSITVNENRKINIKSIAQWGVIVGLAAILIFFTVLEGKVYDRG